MMYAVGFVTGASKHEASLQQTLAMREATNSSSQQEVLYTQQMENEKLLTLSLCWCQQSDEILRNDIEGPNEDGSYKFAYQTQGGIFHEQRGSLQGEEQSLVVEGQYQYTAPDGQVINVVYKADGAGGFQATGDHLPTPPPIPPAIQRALDYLKTLPPSENDY